MDLMSAIFGMISRYGRPIVPAEVDAAGEALAPYGAAHRWSGSVGVCDVVVAEHGRHGAELARSSDGSLVVVSDAFLSRRAALAGELGIRTSSDDSVLILAAYERWGERLLDHLSGEFAFAVIDRRRNGVLLARDNSGERFLAFHETADCFAFASTALALTGVDGVGHELDRVRAAEVVLLGYGTDRTFVQGVRNLMAGNALWVDDGGVRRWRWWKPETDQIDAWKSLLDHADDLRGALDEAVESSLVGSRRPAAQLSGGLDSASIACAAARLVAPERLLTYTSTPPPRWVGEAPHGFIADERFAVEALGRRLPNLEQRFLHVKGSSPFENLEVLWELGAGPIRNPMNQMWGFTIHQEAAVDGVDVLLSGVGGNYAFSADGPRWLAELAVRGRLGSVLREARTWSRARHRSLSRTLRGELLWPLLPNRYRVRRATRAGSDLLTEYIGATAIRPEWLELLPLDEVLATAAEPHEKGWARDAVRMFDVTAAQAESTAAVRALFGVHERHPLLDRSLLEVAFRQPEWFRRSNGITRAICRQAMGQELPPEILDRTTLGAQLPDWFDRLTDVKQQVIDEVEQLRDHPASRDVIDVSRLDSLIAAWPSPDRAADLRVVYDYQCALTRALVVSRYLRWFEDRGRRVASGGPRVVIPPAWQR
jgi:asparagine synthase (glutamine-hydrolysing)